MADRRAVAVCCHCLRPVVRARTVDEQWFSLDAKGAWNRGSCEASVLGIHGPLMASDKAELGEARMGGIEPLFARSRRG